MKKIPTLFVRGDNHLVRNEYANEVDWVARGEGVATRKYDGTCCKIVGPPGSQVLWKRHTLKSCKKAPAGFRPEGHPDPNTGNQPGWILVTDKPEDRHFLEAFDLRPRHDEGTYELLGPKVNNNPEGEPSHILFMHSDAQQFWDAPRGYEELKAWLSERDIEGIVWHHPDGRMVKIKKKDFGLPRKPGGAGQ